MVIFDCDGVLVDSEATYLEVELAMLADLGVHYARADYVRRFMGLPPAAWRTALAADVVEGHGTRLPAGFFDRLDARLRDELERRLRPVAGARDAVTSLAGPRCVASSTPLAHLRWKLRHTGLDDLFGPHVYSADAVEHGKPAPDLFLHAAARSGADPAVCVVVEDSVNGVRAGVAAGMAVVGFTGGGHCAPGHADMLLAAGADAVVDHFAGLAPVVTRITGR